MPFYCYNGKMMCYLWTHKKFDLPYLGVVQGEKINHPELLSEKRAKMKIFLIDPLKDIPVDKVESLLSQMIKLFKG